MPDLNIQVTGVEPAVRGVAPCLHFRLRVANSPPDEPVHAVLLNAQIQIQAPQRNYSDAEKERLLELFGEPERWGQTLRNKFWTQANASVGAFRGETDAVLPVPCTYDLNITAAKYFYALDDGEVPLLFLFSGSVFYAAADGRLQVAPISWNQESAHRLPVRTWREVMEHHFPNTTWLSLRRDVFDRLYACKRRRGLATWEEVIEQLLPEPAPIAGESLRASTETEALA